MYVSLTESKLKEGIFVLFIKAVLLNAYANVLKSKDNSQISAKFSKIKYNRMNWEDVVETKAEFHNSILWCINYLIVCSMGWLLVVLRSANFIRSKFMDLLVPQLLWK